MINAAQLLLDFLFSPVLAGVLTLPWESTLSADSKRRGEGGRKGGGRERVTQTAVVRSVCVCVDSREASL